MMNYKVENLAEIGNDQKLLSDIFSFIAENTPDTVKLKENWTEFFRLWGQQDRLVTLKVFTSRTDSGEVKGLALAYVIHDPLFVNRAFCYIFTDLTMGDSNFRKYINTVLEAM